MISFLVDIARKIALVLQDAFQSFRRNNDPALASSLAFSAMLAIIPALFLLTVLLGMTIGSSAEALQKVQSLVSQALPGYSQVIVREVRSIAEHMRAFGTLNFIIFLLVVTPLVGDLRTALRTIFRAAKSRPFLLEKLFDVAITVVFLLGLTAIAATGIALSIAKEWITVPPLPAYVGGFAQYLFVAGCVFLLYFVYAGRHRVAHLTAGAFASAGLWFVMKPLFHQFLVYNPGYGLAFGSFKSLFVVIIWIYYSLAVFLAGAELAAALERREAIYFKRLMNGRGRLPEDVAERFVVRYEKGEAIFAEGAKGDRMFAVLKGIVALRKGGKDIASIPAGGYVGAVSFMLDAPRLAGAVASEDVELAVITRENLGDLMRESPDLVLAMLRDSASRLRAAESLPD
jgi:YihY family inner membrane protein